MRRLIFASMSVLALGIAGSRVCDAADLPNSSNRNAPGTSDVSEHPVKQVRQELKSAGIHKGAIDGRTGGETLHEARSRQFRQQKGLGPKGVRYDFNFGRH
jgi:hypothetical protein